MRSHRLFPLITALLLAVGAIAAACVGGRELSTEEYFQRLEMLSDNWAERDLTVDAEYRETPSSSESISDEERIRRSRERVRAIVSVQRDFLEKLQELDPPTEVKEAHDAYADALGDLTEATEEFTASETYEDYFIRLSSAESIEELKEVSEAFRDPDFVAVGQHFDEACSELERIAGENDFGIHLGCGD